MGIPINEKPSAKTQDDIISEKKPKVQFQTVKLGIWEVVLPVKTGWDLGYATIPPASELLENMSTYLLLFRLCKDIYMLAPRQFLMFTVFECIQSFEGSINLYLNSEILNAVRIHSFHTHASSLQQSLSQISSHLGGESVVVSVIMRSLASRILLSFMLSWLRKFW